MISICGDNLICSTTVKILLKMNLFFHEKSNIFKKMQFVRVLRSHTDRPNEITKR